LWPALYAFAPVSQFSRSIRSCWSAKAFLWIPEGAALLLKKIRQASELIKPVPGVPIEASDPDDVMFLECAQAARANYLVTGNTKDFPTKWKYTTRITPATFLARWYADHAQSFSP